MAVTSETSSVQYVGNAATTVFPTTFKFLKDEHLVVKIDGVTKTLDVDYTVDGAGDDAGGDVTFTAAPANAAVISITRDTPYTQETSFQTQGTFSPVVHEREFDKGALIDQELDRRVTALESSGLPSNAVAGDGLVVVDETWFVGAGNGIVTDADSVSVDYGGAPADVDTAAASAGVATTVSRSDHKHKVTTAAPVAISVGAANVEGVASTLARSDHTHALAAPAAPANVTKGAANAGASTSVARADHKHDVDTAAAIELTDSTNAEGNATSLARANHTHAHGNRGGGTLHAEATTAAAGFMSAADKTKLDALAGTTDGTVQTTDATATVVAALATDRDGVYLLEAMIVGLKSDYNTGGGYHIAGTFRRKDGIVAQVGATTGLATHEDDAAWSVAFAISGTTIQVKVTGVAATTILWAAKVQYVMSV